MLIKTLESEADEVIRRCFAEAFADYTIQVDFTLERYHRHCQRFGVALEHSMGAYLDGQLVGFVLNSAGVWNGRRTLYDAGTGVIPAARGQKVTEQILQQVRRHARENGFEQYLLEVIQSNAAAIRVYQKQGFRTVRELCSFRAKKADLALDRSPDRPSDQALNPRFETIPAETVTEEESFWDYRPSWQNSSDALRRSPHLRRVIVETGGSLAGYAIYGPEGGEIVQLAVRSDARGRGVGSSLLAGVADRTTADTLTVLNVEKTAEAARSFWSRRFQPLVDQYEMMLSLG